MLEHDRIVQDIKEGNKGTFQGVFHAYYEGLCQYAFTILRNMDDAEDVVQAMFLKIWEKRGELVITQTIKAYLYKAVYNQCMNHLEHRVVRAKFQESTTLRKMTPVQLPEVFPAELEERIKVAINRLPPQCRTIFLMSRYEDLKYAQIAEALNLSVNTIENQISKALKILRAHIRE